MAHLAAELYADLFRVCRPALEAADRAGETLHLRSQSEQVEAHFQELFAQEHKVAKAKRKSKKNNTGTVAATGQGAPHGNAGRKQSGTRMPAGDAPIQKFRLLWEDDNPDSFARVEENAVTFNVYLQQRHAGVIRNRDNVVPVVAGLVGIHRGHQNVQYWIDGSMAPAGATTKEKSIHNFGIGLAGLEIDTSEPVTQEAANV